MLRAQYDRRGPVPQDVIEAVHFETPSLRAGQVLVEVVAAPINPADVLTLTGEYGQLPPLPAIGGREGVGRVAELGSDTGEVRVGQLVLLPLGCGSWSSHVVVEAAQLRPLPDEADPLQLSMMAINPPTAALLLSEFVMLGPGDWVIQNAANSAVGLYLVQRDTAAIGLSTSFAARTRRLSCAIAAATSCSSTARTWRSRSSRRPAQRRSASGSMR
jgi:mitochondrial enoyl-[acyl-carrier protein] reductase / trans-2-enoyl-CoA reductase